MNNTRLSKRMVRKSRKTLFLTIGGIAIILGLLFKFGIPLLINFSSFVAAGNSSNFQKKLDSNPEFVAPPVLNSTFTATNSAQVAITGSARANNKVVLYLNDNVINQKNADNNGSFSFSNITLTKENNNIKAKIIAENNQQSDFSNILYIEYNNKAPALSINTPTDGQTFSKDNDTVTVTGKTDPGVKVTVNGLWAIVDENGKYSYNFHLQNGENVLKIIATNDAGNTTEQDEKVMYSQ